MQNHTGTSQKPNIPRADRYFDLFLCCPQQWLQQCYATLLGREHCYDCYATCVDVPASWESWPSDCHMSHVTSRMGGHRSYHHLELYQTVDFCMISFSLAPCRNGNLFISIYPIRNQTKVGTHVNHPSVGGPQHFLDNSDLRTKVKRGKRRSVQHGEHRRTGVAGD